MVARLRGLEGTLPTADDFFKIPMLFKGRLLSPDDVLDAINADVRWCKACNHTLADAGGRVLPCDAFILPVAVALPSGGSFVSGGCAGAIEQL